MSTDNQVRLVECPRDAIQGVQHFIPTQKKVIYVNTLIASGLFDCIDFGSFVAPAAVPQMKDTAAVVEAIEKLNNTKLSAVIVNEKGAEIGSHFEKIDFLGYPFSISETFQQRNTNSSIEQSYRRVENILNILYSGQQELAIYISMAFGNPYGDPWTQDLVIEWVDKLSQLGIRRFSLADTTSQADPQHIGRLFRKVIRTFPDLEWSAHFHSRVENALLKVESAYQAGCRRFEGAFLGFGGCPFAQDDLVGNIPMELLLDRFKQVSSTKMGELMDGFQNLIRKGHDI